MSSGQPGDGQSDHNLGGEISITPIEINLKSALSSEDSRDSSAVPRPRVQFSDKVERFPESVPTSPNPFSPKAEDSKKFPVEPEKIEVPIKQVEIQRPTENGHSQLNGAPQIENIMSVEHNAPYSAGPHHDLVIECEQLPSKNSQLKSAEQPSPEWSARAVEPKRLMTNVILNIEIVRTQKDSLPEDEDDEFPRVSFSLPAYNVPQGASEIDSKKVQPPTTQQSEQQLLSSQEQSNRQATAVDNRVGVDQSSANSGAEKVAEKVAETVVEEALGDNLQRIDLTPLLNKQPDTSDIAVKNAEVNRNSPLPEGLEGEKKDVTTIGNGSDSLNENEKTIEIPVTVVDETTPFDHEAEVKNVHGGLPVVEDIVGDSISNEKFVDIPITFENSESLKNTEFEKTEVASSAGTISSTEAVPSTELSEPSETSRAEESLSSKQQLTETPITYEDLSNESKDAELKFVEIPITFETETFPFIESDAVGKVHKGLPEAEPLPDNHISDEKLVEIKITFEEGQQEQVNKDNDQPIEIPVQIVSTDEKEPASYVSKEPSSTEGNQNSTEQSKEISITIETEAAQDSSTSNAANIDGIIVMDESSKEKSADIPVASDAVNTQQEKIIDIAITFGSVAAPSDDNSGAKDIHKELPEIVSSPDNSNSGFQEKGIEAPVQFEELKAEEGKVEEKPSDISAPNKDSETGNQQEKLIDIPITFESETVPFDDNSIVKDTHKGIAEAESLPEEAASGPEEKSVEIPIIFEEEKPENKKSEENNSEDKVEGTKESPVAATETVPPNSKAEESTTSESQPEVELEQKLSGAESSKPAESEVQQPKLDEIKTEEQSAPESVVEPQIKNESLSEHPVVVPIIQISKPEEYKSEQSQPIDQPQPVEQPSQPVEPIKVETFETPIEKLEDRPVSTSPVTVIPPSEPSADGVNYQSAFAKPLLEENKPKEAEKVNTKPDEVVFQSTFARPMSQEPSPTEKKSSDGNFSSVQQPTESSVVKPNLQEKKSEEPVQQGFAKPLLDESNRNSDNSIQTGFAKPLLDDSNKLQENDSQTGFTKPLYEEPKKNANDGIVYQTSFAKPMNEESKSASTEMSKPQQDSQPPTPQWQKPQTNQWMDSYDDGQTIWDKPATGVVRDIPITIQTGKDSSQQGQGVPQQSISGQQFDSAAQQEPSAPKTFVSSDILYYEVPPESEKSQQQVQQSASQTSPWGSQKPEEKSQQEVQQSTPQASSWENQKPEEQSKPSTDYQQPLKSPSHSQGRRSSDEVELNIKEYEENLKKNTQEALQLVDKLVESSQKIQQMEHERRGLEERKKERERDAGERSRSRSRSSSRSRSVQFSESALVEAHSYRVNPDLLKDANSVVMLPEYKIALADYENGLTLFNLSTKDIKRVEGGNKWRNPQCLTYNTRAKEFFVLVEYSEKEDGKYERYILRFNQQMEYINRVEAPKFIADKDVSVFRMCYCPRTGCLYLAASTYASGFLYELSPEDLWTEVYTCRNKIFTDITILAVVGPVTELLVLESTRSYVNIISVYGTEATHTRMLAVCEKPGTFCIDEVGHLMVHDKASSKISFHSKISFLKTSEITLVEHANVHISAWDGLLAVLCPSKKDLRIYKY